MNTPVLTQFRVESQANGIVHLVFDCPNRTMNVFSNAAIHELATFAAWLAEADVKGVLIRSGKDNAFCAGADLTELGGAYDMIMEAKPRDRFNRAFDHFFPLSKAIRALETAGKPVAAAIAGLALGGGCELALGAHYRVLVDDPKIGMGLPESLVGLLPGAGGTQRLPRLVGVDVALPILLDGGRLAGQAALDAGLVHELATAGEEIARAEAWLLALSDAAQPWDRAGSQSPAVTPTLTERRASADPHNPAITAILDCVEFGLPQSFEGAIRSEMAIFAALIQRPEPRNMIQTLFLGKTDYDRAARKEALPSAIAEIVAAAQAVPGDKAEEVTWRAISAAVAPLGAALSFEERRIADYACVAQAGFPASLGGPFTFAERGFD
jgi:3-hydroxyacyl-CoA dehydrogenase / enoyl-CoA hydratase / 3-hydroxybutyryl-CoA epimerase